MDGSTQGTSEWVAGRKAGIGGSEVAALFPKAGSPTGCHHPWLTPYKLWALKTGRVASEESDPLATPQLWWGTKLEPVVRAAYSEITGRAIVDGHTHLRHPEIPVMLANTDGTIVGDERGPGVYEGKTTTIFSKDAWSDGVPLYYQAQVQHYLACTGYSWGSVALYMAGERQPLKYYDIVRNDAFIANLCERVQAWWDRHVLGDEPPEVDGSDVTRETIASVYPAPDPGSIIAMPEGWLEVEAKIGELAERIKADEEAKAQLQNRLRAAIGSAEYASLPDGSGWTYRQTTRKPYTKTVAGATFRQLRRVKDISKAIEKAR